MHGTSEAGNGILRIGGVQAEFAILKQQTAAEILSAIKAAIAAKREMPVIAGTIDDDELPLTAKWRGASGNAIKVSVASEVPGVVFDVTHMTGGAIDSDAAPALALFGQVGETFILSCFAWNDASRLDQYQVFSEGRWGELEKKPCLIAHGCVDDFATRSALTDQRKTDYANFLNAARFPADVFGRRGRKRERGLYKPAKYGSGNARRTNGAQPARAARNGRYRSFRNSRHGCPHNKSSAKC